MNDERLEGTRRRFVARASMAAVAALGAGAVSRRGWAAPLRAQNARQALRNVRVAAVSYQMPPHDHTRGVNLDPLADVVRQVARADRPNFICFPETCACSGPIAEGVHRAPEIEPFTAEVGKLAREVGAALIVPTLERQGGKVFNSVPIVDSKGKLVMVYRKNYPTTGEIESGITPGREAPVAECDGVRVGAAVCFDVNFAQVAADLERGRARIVFWPSMFWGGQLLQHWAFRYGFYVAASYRAESAVIDMSGRYLVKQGQDTHQVRAQRLPPWAVADVNPNREVFHLDNNQEKFAAIRKKYGGDVQFEVFQPEAVFLLSSRSPEISVEGLAREFDLEPLRDYLARSVALRNRALDAR